MLMMMVTMVFVQRYLLSLYFGIRYLDVVDGTNDVDLDAQNLLSVLKNEKVFKALPDERNMEYFEVSRYAIKNFSIAALLSSSFIAIDDVLHLLTS